MSSASMLAEPSARMKIRLPPTLRPLRYCRSPSPTKERTLRPGTSWLGVPPESRFAPSSAERTSAFSLLTLSRFAIVWAS